MKTLKQFTFLLGLITILWSCDSDFLDAKPQKSLLVPTTLTDLEALLNNSNSMMNRAGYLTLAADGDFRISDTYLPFVNDPIRFNYTWSDETTNWIGDWDYAYQQVFYANVVLQGLSQMKGQYDKAKANELRGRALFYKVWALHLTAEQFSGPYDQEMAAFTPGIPFPDSPDVNQVASRLSIKDTYSKIFNDLNEALELLPNFADHVTQPSKSGTLALLSRLYLNMSDYNNALKNAEALLAITDELLDYNDENPTLARPFTVPYLNPNPEILFYSYGTTSFTANNNVFIDSSLYSIYENNDLRKELFYTERLNYKGSYTGGNTPFVGLATDEIHLIKAECLTRLDKLSDANTSLNYFLSRRYKTQGVPEIKEMNKEELLKFILLERRRELVGRGTTWMDLRRLNQKAGFERTLNRTINGKAYTLLPKDKRYIMKIPMDEIAGSGIEQNI